RGRKWGNSKLAHRLRAATVVRERIFRFTRSLTVAARERTHGSVAIFQKFGPFPIIYHQGGFVRVAPTSGIRTMNFRKQPTWITGFQITILGLAAFLLAVPTASSQPGVDFFESKIRPVLVEHCYSCHSVEAKKRKGGLL